MSGSRQAVEAMRPQEQCPTLQNIILKNHGNFSNEGSEGAEGSEETHGPSSSLRRPVVWDYDSEEGEEVSIAHEKLSKTYDRRRPTIVDDDDE